MSTTVLQTVLDENAQEHYSNVCALVDNKAILASARYAVLHCSGQRKLVTMLCDAAIGYLMDKRFDDFRELADAAMRELMVDAALDEQ